MDLSLKSFLAAAQRVAIHVTEWILAYNQSQSRNVRLDEKAATFACIWLSSQ